MDSLDAISPFTFVALGISLLVLVYGAYKAFTYGGNPAEEGLGFATMFLACAIAIVSVGTIEFLLPLGGIILTDILS